VNKLKNKLFLKLFLIFAFSVTFSLSAQTTDLKIDHFIPNVPVNDISSDGQNIWFATNGRGVFKYNISGNKWKNYSTENKKLKIDFFYCITSNGKYVWAGSTDGLFIFNIKRKRWSRRKFGKGGQLGNWIRSVKFDPYQNVVWIGRFQFLTKYDIKKHKYKDYDLRINGNEKTNNIKSLYVDGDSLLWVGTEGGVHKIWKKHKMDKNRTYIFYDNSMNYFNAEGDEVSVSSILGERKYLWFGTDEFITQQNPNFNLGGLFRYDRKDQWIKFDVSNSLLGNGIFSLERTGDYIWASTYEFNQNKKEADGRGIVLVNRITLKIKPIVLENVPNDIYKIFFDGKYVWLGTISGVYRIKLVNNLIPTFNN